MCIAIRNEFFGVAVKKDTFIFITLNPCLSVYDISDVGVVEAFKCGIIIR